MNGVTYTHVEKGLPPLQPGGSVLLMLQRAQKTFVVTKQYYGVFDISGGTLEPKLPREDFVLEYRGHSLDKVINALPALLDNRQEG
ncbi:MAG TPA: hypothetical protein VH583_10870 [Vicinamibacterales bacterium]